jgi:pimeloyl-ACP methyl ester carboxylesterase
MEFHSVDSSYQRPTGARMYRSINTGLLVLIALCLTSCTILSSTTTAKVTPNARPIHFSTQFKEGTCPFSLQNGFVDGQNVLCGFLNVPEDRSDPHSATIQLAVAIFKTPSATPAPDPIIFLQGGPGGRVIADFAPLVMSHQLDLATQFDNHDLIFIDQRGTGYSKPSLQCPEYIDVQHMTDQNLTPDQQVMQQDKALVQCHDRLVKSGIKLSAYTTYNDAADIQDLIEALKLKQVDLYSVSYGTRLALEVMRAFPQHIRSVILDSTVPAQLRLITSAPSDLARVYSVLFKGCKADSFCNVKYPNLESVFYADVASLNAHPATFQTQDPETNKSYTVTFTGNEFADLLFSAFYATSIIPTLPEMIYQVKQGNLYIPSLLYGPLFLDDSVSWGMYFSVECAEDLAFSTPQAVAAAGQAYPQQIRSYELSGLEGEFPVCRAWNVPAVARSESQPVTSSIPTLVLEGEYDPVTPPADGALAAQSLRNSYQFLFPATGHGVFLFNPSSCPTTIVVQFERNPAQKPDGSCIVSMSEPRFQ